MLERCCLDPLTTTSTLSTPPLRLANRLAAFVIGTWMFSVCPPDTVFVVRSSGAIVSPRCTLKPAGQAYARTVVAPPPRSFGMSTRTSPPLSARAEPADVTCGAAAVAGATAVAMARSAGAIMSMRTVPAAMPEISDRGVMRHMLARLVGRRRVLQDRLAGGEKTAASGADRPGVTAREQRSQVAWALLPRRGVELRL